MAEMVMPFHWRDKCQGEDNWAMLSTVLTAALWLGNDDFDTVRKCAGAVYQQLKQLKTIKHPLNGKEIKLVRQSCGDGKERRSSTGNSSAKSSYSIPEAPEHHSQLGDMKLSCPCPVWSGEDTETLEMKFNIELREKAPSKEKHQEFVKQNLGNTGHTNICGTPLSEFYPGPSHLGFRSAETICLRMAKLASGLYLWQKKASTSPMVIDNSTSFKEEINSLSCIYILHLL